MPEASLSGKIVKKCASFWLGLMATFVLCTGESRLMGHQLMSVYFNVYNSVFFFVSLRHGHVEIKSPIVIDFSMITERIITAKGTEPIFRDQNIIGR